MDVTLVTLLLYFPSMLCSHVSKNRSCTRFGCKLEEPHFTKSSSGDCKGKTCRELVELHLCWHACCSFSHILHFLIFSMNLASDRFTRRMQSFMRYASEDFLVCYSFIARDRGSSEWWKDWGLEDSFLNQKIYFTIVWRPDRLALQRYLLDLFDDGLHLNVGRRLLVSVNTELRWLWNTVSSKFNNVCAFAAFLKNFDWDCGYHLHDNNHHHFYQKL